MKSRKIFDIGEILLKKRKQLQISPCYFFKKWQKGGIYRDIPWYSLELFSSFLIELRHETASKTLYRNKLMPKHLWVVLKIEKKNAKIAKNFILSIWLLIKIKIKKVLLFWKNISFSIISFWKWISFFLYKNQHSNVKFCRNCSALLFSFSF